LKLLAFILVFSTSVQTSVTPVTTDVAPMARLLIIGDSVFDAFDHVASARRILNEHHATILAVQWCQKLVEPGCIPSAKLSALDQLRRYSGHSPTRS